MATREANLEEQREQHSHASRYVLIWAVLLLLTGVTYVTAKLDLGSFSLPLALLIASVKSALVVLFFMHLWEQQGANRLVFAVAVIFVALLISLSVADLATRNPITRPDVIERLIGISEQERQGASSDAQERAEPVP